MRIEFPNQLMNAAGMLGFTPEVNNKNQIEPLGSFVSNPISLRPRRAVQDRQHIEVEGGVLIHTGMPNPGVNASVRRFSNKWARARKPIIVNLFGDDAAGLSKAIQKIEEIENVMAIELTIGASWSLQLALELCRAAFGELPLIANIGIDRALEMSHPLFESGAEAISLGPMRGSAANDAGEIISGRFYGSSMLERTLLVSGELAKEGVPVIAGGGINKLDEAKAILDTGAMAVQLDSVLWKANWNAADWEMTK